MIAIGCKIAGLVCFLGRGIVFILLGSWITLLALGQDFRINPPQVDVLISPGFNHLPITVNVLSNAAPFDITKLTVTSDSSWVTPSVDAVAGKIVLKFATSNLVSLNQTATLHALQGTSSNTFFVNASLVPLNVVKLIDDPIRSRVYGIHINGTERGNLLVTDPLTGAGIGSLTVGRKPTDLAVSKDGKELFVINTVDETISVINLETFEITETIQLPAFDNWGANDTTADIEAGPNGFLYYTDGSWGPVLRVFDRTKSEVIQAVTMNEYGFGDFGLTADFKTLIGWVQYGWSAGWAGSYAVRFTVDAAGKLTFAEQTENQWPTGMVRDPLDAPVLISSDDQLAFVKQFAFNTGALSPKIQAFPGPIYSISPGGEIAATVNAIYERQTGNKLYDLPVNATAQVITSDYARLVYFDSAARVIKTMNLLGAIGPDILGRNLSPANGSIVLPPERLSWQPLAGIDRYNVYLGSSEDEVAAAQPGSALFLGTVSAAEYFLNRSWQPGEAYFWRVDPVMGNEAEKGDVYRFTVSSIAANAKEINEATIQGHRNFRTSVDLYSETPGHPWQAISDVPWISFTETNGATPAVLTLVLDASQLPAGFHSAGVQIRDGTNVLFTLPVKLRVEALKLTLLESDPSSELVYGINEDSGSPANRAYLLEINTRTEGIERIIPVGNSVTDLAVHNGDGRIYVPNWMGGSLLAIDKETFTLERTYAFRPFAGTGYGDSDVYKVAPGAPGRLVIEEEDQWIDITIFDTVNGTTIAKAGVREGGGATAPGGRFYYHGDNNSSGAAIHKFDLTGDAFLSLANIRVTSGGYYGHRTVVVSDDGQRIFWNGSVFNPDLEEEWEIGDLIFSTTPDGRYAFGSERIYDVVQRRAVLGMPAPTQVSAFNSMTRKLVVQVDGAIRFYLLTDPLTLPKPTLSLASITENSASLRWTDNSLGTGFTLQRRLAGESAWINVGAIPSNADRMVVSQLGRETTYDFRIKADAVGLSSEWSDILTVTTPGSPPAKAFLSIDGFSSSSVVLSWSGISADGQYFLERRISEAGSATNWTRLAVLPAATNQITDSNVISGTSYEYQVRGTNQWGASVSDIRSIFVPRPSRPQPPQLLSVRLVQSGAVEVNWVSSAGATGYNLHRRTEKPESWMQIAQLGSVDKTFLDTNVLAGTEYWYRVAAFNAVGESDFSNAANVLVVEENVACMIADSFDPGLDPRVWAELSGGFVAAGAAGFNDGNALWFGTNTTRSATTIPLPMQAGSLIQFKLRAGNEEQDGNGFWNNSETGEGILLEFSTDGFIWNVIQVIDTAYPRLAPWTDFSVPLPPHAASSRTQIRLRQTKHSGAGFDSWAIDDFCIRGTGSSLPGSPSFVMASANSSTSVAVLWFGSSGASHYIIERKAEGSLWEQIGITSSQQTYFTDVRAMPQTSYAYRVKAATTVSESDYSPVALVTTLSQSADWLLANFASTNTTLTAYSADGVPNIIRYAYNLRIDDPLVSLNTDNRGIPKIWFDPESRRLRAEFIRRKAAGLPGISYRFQVSDDLVDWENMEGTIHREELSDLWERVIYEDSDGRARVRYVRVVVQLLP